MNELDTYYFSDKLWETLSRWSGMDFGADMADAEEILHYLPGLLLFCVGSTPALAQEFERLSTLNISYQWISVHYDARYGLTDFWEELKAKPDCAWFVGLLEGLRFPNLLDNPVRREYAVNVATDLNWYSVTPDEIRGYFEAILESLESPEHNNVPPVERLSGWFVELLVTLLTPKAGESIYDPQCGVGDLLFAARQAVKISENGIDLVIYGQEWDGIDAFYIGIAEARAILQNISRAHFTTGAVWEPPKFLEEELVQKFDGVITYLSPYTEFFGGKLWVSGNQYSYEKALMQIYACLKDTGRAVVLLTEELLYGQDYEKLRAYLVENDAVETVITLPEHIIKDEPPLAILVLNKAKPGHATERIRFIHAIETYVSDEQRDHIVQAANTEDDINGFARWVDLTQVRQQNCILCPDKYIAVTGLNDFLGGLTTHRHLGAIASVIRGKSYFGDESNQDGPPIITDDDLVKHRIPIESLPKAEKEYATEYATILDGDILISATRENEAVYLCDASLEGVGLEESVYILRLNKEYRGLAAYLAEYLRSDIGARQLRMARRRVFDLELLNIIVPIPEARVSVVLNALRGVELRLGERGEHIRQLRSRLFGVKDPGELNRELEALSIQAQVLDASLLQVEDLNFQLRNYFPFPVVYAYRLLDATSENSARYREQMRVAENLLAFLAAMGLSLAKYLGTLGNSTIETLKRESLEKAWQKGISPGDLQQQVYACARLMRDLAT